MWLFVLLGLVMPLLALAFVVPAYLLDPAPGLRAARRRALLGARYHRGRLREPVPRAERAASRPPTVTS